MSNQFHHNDLSHLNHSMRESLHAMHYAEEHENHKYGRPYHFDSKGERFKMGWNLGLLTAAGLGIATGVTGGLAPLLV